MKYVVKAILVFSCWVLGNPQTSIVPVDSINLGAEPSTIGNTEEKIDKGKVDQYLTRKLSPTESYSKIWKLDGVDIGYGFVPTKEIEIAREFNSSTSGEFGKAAVINWVSFACYLGGMFLFADNLFLNYEYIDGADGKRYRAQSVDDFSRPKFYFGTSLTIAGVIGTYIGIRKYKKALSQLDKDMQKKYFTE